MKRLFAAFPVRGELANEFLKIAGRNSNVEGIRWAKSDNLHITLFFIGEVEEGNVDEIISRFQIISRAFKSFELVFEEIEIRYTKRKPSMIWGKFERCDEFTLLSNDIETSVKEFMTIDSSHKDPIPHCTLARVKPNAEIEKVNLEFDTISPVEIDKIELWQTKQTVDGVRYESL